MFWSRMNFPGTVSAELKGNTSEDLFVVSHGKATAVGKH